MPDHPRYFTTSGEPPNGGAPPGSVWAFTPDDPPQTSVDESTTDEGGSAVQSDLEEEEEESNTTTDSDSIGFFSEAEKQTSIKFLYNGERPCDSLRGYSHPFEYSEHQVACNRTIRELLCQLGCPDRNGTGVTEIFPQQHGIFAAGRDFTWNNTETLAEVGWTEHRIGENAVWLAVKR